jgi:hypothetical protein
MDSTRLLPKDEALKSQCLNLSYSAKHSQVFQWAPGTSLSQSNASTMQQSHG